MASRSKNGEYLLTPMPHEVDSSKTKLMNHALKMMIFGLIVLESLNIYSANMQSSLWTASGGASAQAKVHLVRFMTPAVLIVTYVRLSTSNCFSDF